MPKSLILVDYGYTVAVVAVAAVSVIAAMLVAAELAVAVAGFGVLLVAVLVVAVVGPLVVWAVAASSPSQRSLPQKKHCHFQLSHDSAGAAIQSQLTCPVSASSCVQKRESYPPAAWKTGRHDGCYAFWTSSSSARPSRQ